MATSDRCTLVTDRQLDGKMRVTSGSWDGEKVFLRDQVLGVRNVEGRPHIGRMRVIHPALTLRRK